MNLNVQTSPKSKSRFVRGQITVLKGSEDHANSKSSRTVREFVRDREISVVRPCRSRKLASGRAKTERLTESRL